MSALIKYVPLYYYYRRGILRQRSGEKMRLITVHLPVAYISALRKLVEEGLYPNVSEAIRVAIRDFIHKELYRLSQSRESGLGAGTEGRSFFLS